MRPSICFVAPNAFPVLAGLNSIPVIGGAELQQAIVAKELASRGYSVSMICLDFGQADGVLVDGVRVLRACRQDAGLPVVRFLHPRLTSFWRCMVRAGADVYYQRTAAFLTGLVAEFSRQYGKKSVFAAAHNTDFIRPTPRIRFTRDRWMYEYGLRKVDKILVQNEVQGRLCKVNFRRHSTLIPNCYPVRAEQTAASGTYVLWVATIRQIKRPDLFLDLAESLPEYGFRMIGGPARGEESLYATIEARARNICNLEFHGFVPYSTVEKHFDDAAVFVNTSESEGFPNTLLQAWARGVPTVSFVDCGARDDARVLGCQVDSVNAMTSCVERWLASDLERIQVGVRCRAYMEDRHSVSSVIGLYERVLRELVY